MQALLPCPACRLTLLYLLILTLRLPAQMALPAGSVVSQAFNALGPSPTASLPAHWRVAISTTVRTPSAWSDGLTQVSHAAGNNMPANAPNGIYRFNANDLTNESAIGGLTAGTAGAARSVNLIAWFTNSGSETIGQLRVSYRAEKYRDGTNPAGYGVRLYYSADGLSWLACGDDFNAVFAGGDPANTGFAPAPGAVIPVTDQVYTPPVGIVSGASYWLQWSYSVNSGTTVTNAQAIGVDDITVSALQAPAPTGIYTWNAGSGSWHAAANWTPARSSPAPDDILVFDGMVTPAPTVQVTAADFMSQLLFTGGVQATLVANVAGLTLNIGNHPSDNGPELFVAAGSRVVWRGAASGHSFHLQLVNAGTASVAGQFVFGSGGASGQDHRLLAAVADAISVHNTGIIETTAGFTGNLFGSSGTAQVARFEAGAQYRHGAGGNPFVLAQPASKVVFEPGSEYHLLINDGLSLIGRRYAHLILNFAGDHNVGFGTNNPTAVCEIGQLTLQQGTISFPLNVNLLPLVIELTGDLHVGGGHFNFSPSVAGSEFRFTGTALQSLEGSGLLSFGPVATVRINNSGEGLRLNRPVTVAGILRLDRGVVQTSAANLLTLGASASVTGGDENAFVDGPVARQFAAAAAFTFPTGSVSGTPRYRPVTVITQSAAAATFRARCHLTDPTLSPQNAVFLGSVAAIQRNEYWQIDRTAGSGEARVMIPYLPPGAGNWAFTNPGPQSNVAVVRWWGGGWNFTKMSNQYNDQGPEHEARHHSSAGPLYSGVLNDFGPFTAAHAFNGILSEPAGYFRAALAGEAMARLEWSYGDPRSIVRFELEYAPGDDRFRAVAQVAPMPMQTRYEYLLALPQARIHQLRLATYGVDGNVRRSQVITLEEPAAPGWQLITVGGLLQLRGRVQEPGRYVLQLHSATGQLLSQETLDLPAGSFTKWLTAQRLPPGVVHLTVTRDGRAVWRGRTVLQ